MAEIASTNADQDVTCWQLSRSVPSRPLKRSFSISGHRTSISLENAFWEALQEIATDRNETLSALVAQIDRERGDAGLSGAIRVWLLNQYRERARNTEEAGPGS